eukprot:CAMPEP_0170523064 /NCGR_PEP_ID=MMETSP0209-20121228/8466_1 /TAXON_ID=665100 ORGANISM="Litonotus pictus, Strain P1" /NCGR_SAMPLE_ID=MMETSP0209 /ASSEMBLY_ACC=CAM_ASM_000301 /LENGTH=371 /DNA_ID=CAMNT_0010810911 /DNA_START=114 /DNA_END=1226 /DNA_ORIENTATION=+
MSKNLPVFISFIPGVTEDRIRLLLDEKKLIVMKTKFESSIIEDTVIGGLKKTLNNSTHSNRHSKKNSIESSRVGSKKNIKEKVMSEDIGSRINNTKEFQDQDPKELKHLKAKSEEINKTAKQTSKEDKKITEEKERSANNVNASSNEYMKQDTKIPYLPNIPPVTHFDINTSTNKDYQIPSHRYNNLSTLNRSFLNASINTTNSISYGFRSLFCFIGRDCDNINSRALRENTITTEFTQSDKSIYSEALNHLYLTTKTLIEGTISIAINSRTKNKGGNKQKTITDEQKQSPISNKNPNMSNKASSVYGDEIFLGGSLKKEIDRIIFECFIGEKNCSKLLNGSYSGDYGELNFTNLLFSIDLVERRFKELSD